MNEIPDALPEDFDDDVSDPVEEPPSWTPEKDNVQDELSEAMLVHMKDIQEAGGVKKLFGTIDAHAAGIPFTQEYPSLEETVDHMKKAFAHVKEIFSGAELDTGMASQCFHAILGSVQDEWRQAKQKEQEAKQDEPTPEAKGE